jgi:hypothetical protein
MDAEPMQIAESSLAEKLGVSREILTEIRTLLLEPEKDWRRQKNAVVYFQSGVEAACEHLQLPLPTELLAEKKPEVPRTVFVRRAARLNPRIIFVTAEKDGGVEIAVRVRKAAHFVPGQEIRIVADNGEMARLHGPQPRGRGRQRHRTTP